MSSCIQHVKGNLIDLAEQDEFDVIVHGCNCQNTMGSGIAKEIRERYPIAYWIDTNMHGEDLRNPIELLGNFSSTPDTGNIFIYNFTIINAYTQLNYAPRGIDHFEYGSFQLILRKLAVVYPDMRFGLPYIGMGLAGGDKNRIMPMIENFATQVSMTGGSVTLVQFSS